MLRERNPLDVHIGRVKILERADISPPTEWTELYQRYQEFKALQERKPMTQRLCEAITTTGGDGIDLAALRASAMAESADAATQGQVTRAVMTSVHHDMIAVWGKVAARAYGKLADRFNSAAADFAKACRVIDPEADPATVVSSTEEQRTAWMSAGSVAGMLDGLTAPLTAAAQLAGLRIDRDVDRLGLVVDASGADPAEVRQAWVTTGGRCGKWSPLLKAGVTITAANLKSYRPFTVSEPTEVSV